MVCPTCGLENDPSSSACARCNTVLTTAPPPAVIPQIYGGPPRRSGQPSIVAAALAVIVLLAIAAGVLFYLRGGNKGDVGDVTGAGDHQPVASPVATTESYTTGPASTPGPSPQDEAAAIDAILSRSVASRSKLNNAIDRVNRCTDLPGALSDMRDVGTERQSQLGAVASAHLSALANGEQLRSTLSEALRHAFDADQAFVAWAAPTISGRCADTTSRRAAYGRAQTASAEAQSAKRQFLRLWNPIAGQLGLAQRTTRQI